MAVITEHNASRILVVGVDAELLDDKLRAQMADVEAARLKVETLADRVDIAKRAAREAQTKDAEAMRQAVRDGKSVSVQHDRHEKKALAELEQAQLSHQAARQVFVTEVERPFIRALRAELAAVRDRVAERAQQLDAEYAAALQLAIDLREKRNAVFQDQTAITRHIEDDDIAKERRRRAAVGNHAAPDISYFKPRPGSLRGAADITTTLHEIKKNDTGRATPPAPKPTSDQHRRISEDFSRAVSAGGKTTTRIFV